MPVAWAVLIYAWRAPPSTAFLRGPNTLSFIQATHCAEAHPHEGHPIHLPFYQQVGRMLLTAYHRKAGAQSLLAATGGRATRREPFSGTVTFAAAQLLDVKWLLHSQTTIVLC